MKSGGILSRYLLKDNNLLSMSFLFLPLNFSNATNKNNCPATQPIRKKVNPFILPSEKLLFRGEKTSYPLTFCWNAYKMSLGVFRNLNSKTLSIEYSHSGPNPRGNALSFNNINCTSYCVSKFLLYSFLFLKHNWQP